MSVAVRLSLLFLLKCKKGEKYFAKLRGLAYKYII